MGRRRQYADGQSDRRKRKCDEILRRNRNQVIMADRSNLPVGLLADVENYLNITWDDEATDQKIGGLIASGMAYLDAKYGAVADYTKDGMPRTLLMEYVRYARDSALDVFESNYLSLLLGMQNEKAVKDYAQNAIPSVE